MSHVLIVEDEKRLAELERDYLLQASYEVTVINRGDEAIEWLNNNTTDLVVLDLMLPGVDGLEICRHIRSMSSSSNNAGGNHAGGNKDCPIIMTTARVEEIDRLLGLELGADDYLCKPFSLRELVARVKTVLRRYKHLSAPPPPSNHVLHVPESTSQAHFEDKNVELTIVEVNLLHVLMAHPRQIFSRDQLIDRIYEDRRVVSDRTVDSHIKKLRKKLLQIDAEHDYIHSVYGAGYRFEPALDR